MLFGKRAVLLERQQVTVGEFNIEVDGAYENIRTFPLEGKKGRDLYVRVTSDNGVDVSIVDAEGMNMSFSETVRDKTIGPLHIEQKGTMALVLGVFRGDLAHVEVEAWTE